MKTHHRRRTISRRLTINGGPKSLRVRRLRSRQHLHEQRISHQDFTSSKDTPPSAPSSCQCPRSPSIPPSAPPRIAPRPQLSGCPPTSTLSSHAPVTSPPVQAIHRHHTPPQPHYQRYHPVWENRPSVGVSHPTTTTTVVTMTATCNHYYSTIRFITTTTHFTP